MTTQQPTTPDPQRTTPNETRADGSAPPLKVSVITVAYNEVDTLERTLRSVFEQTHPHVESIVVDGGSTDGTVDVIRKHAGRIDQWVSEPDEGIFDAMNKGLRLATGDVIHFLNAGDRFASPDVVATAVRALAEDPECDAVHGWSYRCDDDGRVLYPLRQRIHTEARFRRLGLLHQAVFTRRRMHDRVGAFDTTYKVWADYDFFLKAWRSGCRFRQIEVPICYFHQGHDYMAHREEQFRTLRRNTGWVARWRTRATIRVLLTGAAVYHLLRRPFQTRRPPAHRNLTRTGEA